MVFTSIQRGKEEGERASSLGCHNVRPYCLPSAVKGGLGFALREERRKGGS